MSGLPNGFSKSVPRFLFYSCFIGLVIPAWDLVGFALLSGNSKLFFIFSTRFLPWFPRHIMSYSSDFCNPGNPQAWTITRKHTCKDAYKYFIFSRGVIHLTAVFSKFRSTHVAFAFPVSCKIAQIFGCLFWPLYRPNYQQPANWYLYPPLRLFTYPPVWALHF